MYPDAVSLARWLHLQTRDKFKPIEILNVPLLNGKSWITRDLSLPLVRRQVNAMLLAMQQEHQFARPGAHCESCVGRRCLEMTFDLDRDFDRQTRR